MSQAKLAKAIGVSPSYLNLIEHNRRRLSADLMFKVADALSVDLREFSTDGAASLHAELMDALADPFFDDPDVRAVDVSDLIDNHPAIARVLIKLHRAWQGANEQLATLGDRVVDGGSKATVDASRLPSEEVNDLIHRNMNHFAEVEAAAEHYWCEHSLSHSTLYEGLARVLKEECDVEVQVARADQAEGVIRKFDPERRLLTISETLPPRSRHFHMAWQLGLLTLGEVFGRVESDPQLTSDTSRDICRMVLSNYFAGAMLMPYEEFLSAAEEVRYDIELLGHRFRTSFEQVAHRLTTLRRRGREGVHFHFVKTDTAGNVSKRFSGSGIPFARFSGGCPLWNVNTAFMNPGRIRRQVSAMPDGATYFCIARTVHKRHGGYRSPESVYAIGLGCTLEEAKELVYADGLDLKSAEVVPIGTNCRVCERLDCEQRAFPSLKVPLLLDENVRRIAFYASVES